MTNDEKMPREICLTDDFAAYFNSGQNNAKFTKYVRADECDRMRGEIEARTNQGLSDAAEILKLREALKVAKDALVVGLKIRNDVHPNDWTPLAKAITKIDEVLG